MGAAHVLSEARMPCSYPGHQDALSIRAATDGHLWRNQTGGKERPAGCRWKCSLVVPVRCARVA